MAFTLRELSGLNTTGHDLRESVLIVIDAQQEYRDGTLVLPDLEPAVANIERLLASARAVETPVIHVAHLGVAGAPFDPAGPGQIMVEVAPIDAEPVVEKRLPNSFAHTNLDDLLRTTGRKVVILAGFMTHMCISATARSAIDHGYDVSVVSDAAATRDLPSAVGGDTIPAALVHATALAELADRFAAVVTTDALLAP